MITEISDELEELFQKLINSLNLDGDRKVGLRTKNDTIYLCSMVNLNSKEAIKNDLQSIYSLKEYTYNGVFIYEMRVTAINAFVLRHILRRVRPVASSADKELLREHADKIWLPKAGLTEDKKHIHVNMPNVSAYTSVVKKAGGYPVKSGWRVPITRAMDLEVLVNSLPSALPRIEIDPEVLQLNREPLPNFDGSLESLLEIPMSVLNVVKSNSQTQKSLRRSKKTLEEKLEHFGLKTLHDLLFSLPKRFIDKSNPQEMEGLINGETASVVGVISKVESLPKGMGIAFVIENGRKREIKTNFWRQDWLRAKYKIGDEVLITGKVAWFNRKLQLNGSSIEHLDEAAILPIVPIYKQSESQGITTQFLLAAHRELLSRAGEIELPKYFKQANRMNYTEALNELHFPSSLEKFKAAVDDLAYYELIYMQLILLEEQEYSIDRISAVAMNSEVSQKAAIKALPFDLTKSQRDGIDKINSILSGSVPKQVLLSADVGSGKTLVAQMAALKAIESELQVVMLAPTEILAKQLFSTFEKVNNSLPKAQQVRLAFLQGGMKAAEKRALQKAIKDHEVDAVVATTSALSATVKYANLGLIIVDEQQKFGTTQRDQLLNSRDDGITPHLIMMSATPIPRSTAQVFYGGMEIVELTEKPPGRLPIVTEWVVEDPREFTKQAANHVWSDVANEAEKGNQSFVITPMVFDSDKVDAASVEATFSDISNGVLKSYRIAYIHGKMKKDEQEKVMAEFRNKEFDVLVASTVVEVGVDIPDATRVVILSADRLGASSLHQIRGRVGRSSKPSKCYLVSEGKTENSQVRLQSLVDSEDGFQIAMADLSVRGEGKIFGAEQSGASEMVFASLAKHQGWIEGAKKEAEWIIQSEHRDLALTDARIKFAKDELI